MAVATSTAILTAAVVAGGAAVYSASQAPDAPQVAPPPPPANYYSYDESGNVETVQEWDADRNAYITKRAPLTEEEQAEKAAREELKNNMLANLNNTPEDRVKAYDEYEKTFASSMQRIVDDQYEKVQKSTTEDLNRRGLTGSKADVDKTAALAGEKLKADADIAERAVLAKEGLASSDRDYWLRLLQYSDSKASSDEINALRKSGQAAQIANQGTAAAYGAYTANTNNAWNKWNARLEKNSAMTNALAGLSGNLGMAYAYGGGGNAPLKPSSGKSSFSTDYNHKIY